MGQRTRQHRHRQPDVREKHLLKATQPHLLTRTLRIWSRRASSMACNARGASETRYTPLQVVQYGQKFRKD